MVDLKPKFKENFRLRRAAWTAGAQLLYKMPRRRDPVGAGIRTMGHLRSRTGQALQLHPR